eukprot:6082622-Pleurochrysis_carterae.AAC.1
MCLRSCECASARERAQVRARAHVRARARAHVRAALRVRGRMRCRVSCHVRCRVCARVAGDLYVKRRTPFARASCLNTFEQIPQGRDPWTWCAPSHSAQSTAL